MTAETRICALQFDRRWKLKFLGSNKQHQFVPLMRLVDPFATEIHQLVQIAADAEDFRTQSKSPDPNGSSTCVARAYDRALLRGVREVGR